MMDMVRKHCVQGTGNYITAKACVDRTQQMIRMFRETTHNFVSLIMLIILQKTILRTCVGPALRCPRLIEVCLQIPPRDNMDKIPIGASSASMYPGYSPADHIYGEAAQEYGEHAAELKRNGLDLELDPRGPQYVIGQSRKRRCLSQEPTQTKTAAVSSTSAPNVNGEGEGEPMEGVEQSTNVPQYFTIDSKPTPVTDLGEIQKQKNKANDKAKRQVSFVEGQEAGAASNNSSDAHKSKKAKSNADEFPALVSSESAVQEEDISAEVEARLKAKEEKRRRKEEKKRKRDSRDSLENAPYSNAAAPADGSVERSSIKKLKEKMHKKDQEDTSNATEPSAKGQDRKESEKHKKKKDRAGDDEAKHAAPARVKSEEPKKKRKKDTAP